MSARIQVVLALVAMSWTTGSSAAKDQRSTVEIRVRILRAGTGKPWKGIEMTLYGDRSAEPRGLKKQDICFEVKAATNSDGVARFKLHKPLPPRLIPDIWQVDGCPDPGLPKIITSEEVLRSGIVGRPDLGYCKVKKRFVDAAKPRPGEILTFARPNPSP